MDLIGLSGVSEKEDYNAKIKDIEDKSPHITNLVTTANLNAKINEIKNEVPRFTSLDTTIALNAGENKILDVSTLAKKAEYNTKSGEIKKKLGMKYIATQEFISQRQKTLKQDKNKQI